MTAPLTLDEASIEAVAARREVIECSRQTKLRLLVLLELADAVNEQRLQAGYSMKAWPSQGLLAWRLNSSRRSVARALEELEEAGEIQDTGERKGRGTVVWEITLPDSKPPYDAAAEYGVPMPEVARVAGTVEGKPLPTPVLAEPTPVSESPLPEVAGLPVPELSAEPERNRKEKPEGEHGSGASLPDVLSSSSPPHSNSNSNSNSPALADDQAPDQQQAGGAAYAVDQAGELAALRAQLPSTTGKRRLMTERVIARLEAELGDAAELADQAGVELREATA